jgi:hypothetical protein
MYSKMQFKQQKFVICPIFISSNSDEKNQNVECLDNSIKKGYGSLPLLEHHYFQNHFQDIQSKMDLMDISLIKPTVLYGSKVWKPSLLESNWAVTVRIQALMLCHIIRCKRTFPWAIIQVEFVAHPFKIETILGSISHLHRFDALQIPRSTTIIILIFPIAPRRL